MCAYVVRAEEDDICKYISSPGNMIAPGWNMGGFSAKGSDGKLAVRDRIIFYKSGDLTSKAEAPVDSKPNPLSLAIGRNSIRDLKAVFAKFSEWSAVAKKNGVRTFSKEIGPIGSKYEPTVFTFNVEMGKVILSGKNQSGGSLALNEKDVLAIAGLINRLNELDTALLAIKPELPKSKIESLFK